jgi:uncharacterized protein with von Willebrand factor type A (vWA) domain
MTTQAPGEGHLPERRVPEWLQSLYKQAKGADLSRSSLLEAFFAHHETIKADQYDRKHYKDVARDAKALGDIAKSRYEDDPTWSDLVQDEFLALYKPVPETRGPNEMKPTHRINHAAMNKAQGSKEWETLRTYTELDQWSSAMAAVEFSTRLGEIFDEMKELQEAQQEMLDADQDLQDLLDDIQSRQDEDPDDLIDQLNQQLEAYDQAQDNLNQQLNQSQDQIRQAGRQAAQQAREEAEKSEAALSTFGTDPGELQRMPAEKRFELAARIHRNHKLRELADKIGRMVRFAMGEQARKIVHGRDEVHDIEMGDDLSLVLPTELAFLSDDNARILFLKKYADKELLQYQLRGQDKVAKGAIICMVDSSGSMGGARETWAKAVAIALLNICHKQKRDFYGIIFSSRGQAFEVHFPKGIASIEQVLDFAEFEYMGGTDFEYPIGRAVEVLEHQFQDESAQKGDLVMITDGECAVSEDWMDRYFNAKKELAFRHYGCLIGFNSRVLDTLCDSTYKITDLAAPEEARDVFSFV